MKRKKKKSEEQEKKSIWRVRIVLAFIRPFSFSFYICMYLKVQIYRLSVLGRVRIGKGGEKLNEPRHVSYWKIDGRILQRIRLTIFYSHSLGFFFLTLPLEKIFFFFIRRYSNSFLTIRNTLLKYIERRQVRDANNDDDDNESPCIIQRFIVRAFRECKRIRESLRALFLFISYNVSQLQLYAQLHICINKKYMLLYI